MGVNATTFVPAYVAGEVLTAANLTVTNSGVPVFADAAARDAAFGGTGEKVLAEGQLAYLEDTNKVMLYDGSSWANLGSMTQVDAFTASGTWTVPAGVTYAIAHIRAGGGGVGTSGQGTGGTSSVAFAAGTISATGGPAGPNMTAFSQHASAGATNSGQGAFGASFRGADVSDSRVTRAGDGAEIVAGGAVTPAASITITVGAGGTAGTNGAAGGSGYVWIEYQV
jgi:hypothetical protein